MHKFTLVPSELFSESSMRELLSEVVPLLPEEPLSFMEIKSLDSVLVYSGQRPVLYDMLVSLFKIRDYNKIIASVDSGVLSLVIAEGDTLVLCNEFEAPDFTTAEYFIFLSLKKFQINPELSSIYFLSELKDEQRLSLCNYFKSAEQLQ